MASDRSIAIPPGGSAANPNGGRVAPGSTIGILGGGQLGRMTALAAAQLGYRSHIFCPDDDAPASQVTPLTTRAGYDDEAALTRFAQSVDVITFEFENIPAGAVRVTGAIKPVRPGLKALETSQDRVAEKRFFEREGIATAPWRPVMDFPALAPALAQIGRPALIKTVRMGYDGKGQARLKDESADLSAAWRSVGGKPCILEGMVDFEREISVIVARGVDGATRCYEPVENRHKDGILDTTTVPAPISAPLAREAEAMAIRAAQALDLVGLLAVEMFVTRDGRILASEMAPRPHNSGHWTMDAANTSQFEQLVRAICGLPLGDPSRFADAVMTNLIGDDIAQWPALITEPNTHLHLYGKTEARPGRKMAHVNRIKR
ncbi:MAG TPA: 5-(carboxyamino)imidazole ribonucleotide synthase [Magnetospirillaceae bacterium]